MNVYIYIYEKETITMYLLLYVVFVIRSNNLELLKNIKGKLMKEFKVTNLDELKFFWRIKIENHEMYLSQRQYILNLLSRSNMCDSQKTHEERISV